GLPSSVAEKIHRFQEMNPGPRTFPLVIISGRCDFFPLEEGRIMAREVKVKPTPLQGATGCENVIRAAIRASGISTNALAKALRVSQPAVWLFYSGQRSCSLQMFQRYVDYFGLQLQPKEEMPRSSR